MLFFENLFIEFVYRFISHLILELFIFYFFYPFSPILFYMFIIKYD